MVSFFYLKLQKLFATILGSVQWNKLESKITLKNAIFFTRRSAFSKFHCLKKIYTENGRKIKIIHLIDFYLS